MKTKIIIILILISAVLFSGSYYEIVDEQLNVALKSGFTDNLSEETIDILIKSGFEDLSYEDLSSISFYDLITLIKESLISKITEPFKAVFYVAAGAIICSIIYNFCDNFSQTGKIINAVSALSVSTVFLIPIKNVIANSVSVIEECSNFMLGFIPVYSSAIIASGNVSSAIGFRTFMLGAVTVISRISGEIIAPLICIYIALSVASSVSDVSIGEISKSVKNFAVWLLTLSATVFSGILGLGTLISSSGDKAISKTTKFFIGTAVPIVGGTVSDAFMTVRSCLEITKNILGSYAIFIIAAIFLPSIISLLSWKICLSISAGIGEILENKKLSSLLSSASGIMGIMLAIIVITAIMFIFSISIMLMAGVN